LGFILPCDYRYIFIINGQTLILKIIGQCYVKHMAFPIKPITSVLLMVSMYTNISFAARPVRLAVMQLLMSVSTFKTVILFLTNINVHVDTRQIWDIQSMNILLQILEGWYMYRPLWMTVHCTCKMYIKIVPYTNTIRHNLVRTTRITHIDRLLTLLLIYLYAIYSWEGLHLCSKTSSISPNFKICFLGVIVLYYFKVLALFPFNYLSFL
jgi:hypothetical protein